MMISVSGLSFLTVCSRVRAIQTRHADIGDDQMVLVFFMKGHGLEAVFCFIDLPAVFFQTVIDRDPHDLIVFSEKDFGIFISLFSWCG